MFFQICFVCCVLAAFNEVVLTQNQNAPSYSFLSAYSNRNQQRPTFPNSRPQSRTVYLQRSRPKTDLSGAGRFPPGRTADRAYSADDARTARLKDELRREQMLLEEQVAELRQTRQNLQERIAQTQPSLSRIDQSRDSQVNSRQQVNSLPQTPNYQTDSRYNPGPNLVQSSSSINLNQNKPQLSQNSAPTIVNGQLKYPASSALQSMNLITSAAAPAPRMHENRVLSAQENTLNSFPSGKVPIQQPGFAQPYVSPQSSVAISPVSHQAPATSITQPGIAQPSAHLYGSQQISSQSGISQTATSRQPAQPISVQQTPVQTIASQQTPVQQIAVQQAPMQSITRQHIPNPQAIPQQVHSQHIGLPQQAPSQQMISQQTLSQPIMSQQSIPAAAQSASLQQQSIPAVPPSSTFSQPAIAQSAQPQQVQSYLANNQGPTQSLGHGARQMKAMMQGLVELGMAAGVASARQTSGLMGAPGTNTLSGLGGMGATGANTISGLGGMDVTGANTMSGLGGMGAMSSITGMGGAPGMGMMANQGFNNIPYGMGGMGGMGGAPGMVGVHGMGGMPLMGGMHPMMGPMMGYSGMMPFLFADLDSPDTPDPPPDPSPPAHQPSVAPAPKATDSKLPSQPPSVKTAPVVTEATTKAPTTPPKTTATTVSLGNLPVGMSQTEFDKAVNSLTQQAMEAVKLALNPAPKVMPSTAPQKSVAPPSKTV